MNGHPVYRDCSERMPVSWRQQPREHIPVPSAPGLVSGSIKAPDANRGTPRGSGSRHPCRTVWKREPTVKPASDHFRSRPMARSPIACAPGLYWASRPAAGDGAAGSIKAPDANRGTPRGSGSRRPCRTVRKRDPASLTSSLPSSNHFRSRPMARSPVACAPGLYWGNTRSRHRRLCWVHQSPRC